MRERLLDGLALWADAELEYLANRYQVPRSARREVLIPSIVAAIVAHHEGMPTLLRAHAAGMVASVVKRRWVEAHIARWMRDEGGRPVPWVPGAVHTYVVSYRGTTPSGRNLVRCASCAMKPTDVPGPNRACPGSELDFLTFSVAVAIEGGVVYVPDAAGLPLPEPGPAVVCLRCGQFGPWTNLDRAARQRVCDACFELPFPTSHTR